MGLQMGGPGGHNMNMGKNHPGDMHRRGVMNGMYPHHMQGPGGIISGQGGVMSGGHMSMGSYRSTSAGNVLPGGGGGRGHMSGARDMTGYSGRDSSGGGGGGGGGYHQSFGGDRERERLHGGERDHRLPPRGGEHRNSGKERGGGRFSGGYMATAGQGQGLAPGQGLGQGQGLAPGQGLGPGQGQGSHTRTYPRSHTSPGPHSHAHPAHNPAYSNPNLGGVGGVGGQLHTSAAPYHHTGT